MEEQYQTIAKKLLSEIKEGSFGKDSALPTRTELAGRFNVARSTMDRAVALLIKKGVLDASRGAGTFIAERTRNYHVGIVFAGEPLPKTYNCKPGFSMEAMPASALAGAKEQAALSRFDGIIWFCPEEEQRAWIAELSGSLPQMVVNRDFPEASFISTDHRTATKQLCASRLAAAPTALPVFLGRLEAASVVWGMREEGFIDACRESQRFYEMLPLPADFEEALATLDSRFETPLKRQLILVSGSLENTGAALAWMRIKGIKPGRDAFYSDFDNTYPKSIWGCTVTSFVQDYELMLSEAAESLAGLVEGRSGKTQRFIMPRLIAGDT